MRIRLIDKLMNKLIRALKISQAGLSYIDRFYDNRRMAKWTVVVVLVLLSISGVFNWSPGVFSAAILLTLIILFYLVRGWQKSVVQFFKLVVILDILIAFVGTSIISATIDMSGSILRTASITIYFIFWVWLSLLADPRVAKMTNQIISTIITIVFTAGTYIYSIKFADYSIPDILIKAAQNEDVSNINSQMILSEFLKALCYEFGNSIFMFLLPFLCISLFGLMAVDIKEYWLKKNGKVDFWPEQENTREIIEDK